MRTTLASTADNQDTTVMLVQGQDSRIHQEEEEEDLDLDSEDVEAELLQEEDKDMLA